MYGRAFNEISKPLFDSAAVFLNALVNPVAAAFTVIGRITSDDFLL